MGRNIMEKVQKTTADYINDLNVNNSNLTAFESLGGSTIDYKSFEFNIVNQIALNIIVKNI